MQHLLHSLADTQRLAQQLATQLHAGMVYLHGDLGAGKTTFSQYLLQAMGVSGRIKSPTYTIIEPYVRPNGHALYHCDLYRLQDPFELDLLGFADYVADPQALIIVEWPSKGQGLLPAADLDIVFTVNDEVRKVEVKWGFESKEL